MADEQAAAGWHPDPEGTGRLRFWDGSGWRDRWLDSPPASLPVLSPDPIHSPTATTSPGFFEKRKIRKADRERAAQDARFAAHALAAEADRRAREAQIRWRLELARDFEGLERGELRLQLKKGERGFGVFSGSHLVEPRRESGHWEGRSQSVSVRVPGTKSMRYKVGGSRGTYVRGEEVPTPIDTGTVTVTNQRCVFTGSKQSREWAFAKLMSIDHSTRAPWTSIAVSNRQKVSGFSYDEASADRIQFLLDLGLAHYHDEVDDLVADLEADLRDCLSARRALPPP